MTAIEIARQLAELDQTEQAIRAYGIAIHESGANDPAVQMEGALYILQNGGDYKVSYSCLLDLYKRGHFQAECLSIMTQAFYEPNSKLLKTRYENNCKLLKKYPYLFRKDFIDFEFLPLRFYPFDDNRFVPYIVRDECFGDYIDFKKPVISRNFFKELDKPILAADVFSQYELEYLNDNVRQSEYVGKENHIYLHYTDWATFCAHLQCLNMRALLEEKKFVFLIEDEIIRYPIDFKEQFGINYSQYPVKPLGIREVNRLIWHTQLSSHNGGDFFNEIMDAHPNLLPLTSVMFNSMEENIQSWRDAINGAKNSKEVAQSLFKGNTSHARVIQELCSLPNLTDKDIIVAIYLTNPSVTAALDTASRISPALFFQPHFSNILYGLQVDSKGRTVLKSQEYDKTVSSPIFRGFKYIKTFTPMRRFTTSHGATVKFMNNAAQEDAKKGEAQSVVPDAVSQRILNRSFMVDWQDRLYQDCVSVRLEDGKLNPKATFTALAAFLDIPYTESMTYCSANGQRDPYSDLEGYAAGFSLASVYNTYDEFVNDSERKYIEYFLRDAYEYYGYDFQYYDGRPVDFKQVEEWCQGFTTIDSYIRETWKKVFKRAEVSVNDQRLEGEVEENFQQQLLEKQVMSFHQNRLRNAEVLMGGLRFVNRHGQPLRMMPKLELDPALLEQPLYH